MKLARDALDGRLDRAVALRARSGEIEQLVTNPEAVALVHTEDAILVAGGQDTPRLCFVPALELLASGVPRQQIVFLGLAAGRPIFGYETPSEATLSVVDGRWTPVLLASMQLPLSEGSLANYAVGLANWKRSHRFCSRCGQPTSSADGGHLLVCASGHRAHPRVEPVVQMLVHDDQRCLLGRAQTWPQRWMSTLAGFVDIGETPEQAVVREAHEEAGVTVREVRYAGAQFWAGPRSLMLGFDARCETVDDATAGDELESVRLFTPRELTAAIADGSVLAPSPGVLAGDLIATWIGRGDTPR